MNDRPARPATPRRRGGWLAQALTLCSDQSNAAGLGLVGHYMAKLGVSLPPVTVIAARDNRGASLTASLRTARACVEAWREITYQRSDPWEQTAVDRASEIDDALSTTGLAVRSALAGALGVLTSGCRDDEVLTAAADALTALGTEAGVEGAELLADPTSVAELGPALVALATALRAGKLDEAQAQLRVAFEQLSAAAASVVPPPLRRFTSLVDFEQAAKRVEMERGLQVSYSHEVEGKRMFWLGPPFRPPPWELDCPELDALARLIEARYPFPQRIRYFMLELVMHGWGLHYGPHLCCYETGDDLAELVSRVRERLEALPPDWEPPDPEEIGRHTETY